VIDGRDSLLFMHVAVGSLALGLGLAAGLVAFDVPALGGSGRSPRFSTLAQLGYRAPSRYLPEEVANVWRLWKAGIVRENYARMTCRSV
jgi:hypothetical protein